MADVACTYTLTTPGGNITLNDGSSDQYLVQGITGLGTAPIRAPIDDVPYGDGSLWHNFWKGGRPIVFEGIFLVTSVMCPDPAVIPVWNQMEEDLRAALESIAAATTDTGTLAWTPTGQSARTLTVRHNGQPQLECPPDQNFLVRAFSFGIFAADPNW